MENLGFIKLSRTIQDNIIWKNPKTLKLALYLLLNANHKEGTWNGEKIGRGELITGRKSLSKKLNLSEGWIYKNLQFLKKVGFCNIKSNNEFSRVFILDYDGYKRKSNNKSNNGVTTEEQRSNTNNNDKNEYNEKNFVLRRGSIKNPRSLIRENDDKAQGKGKEIPYSLPIAEGEIIRTAEEQSRIRKTLNEMRKNMFKKMPG